MRDNTPTEEERRKLVKLQRKGRWSPVFSALVCVAFILVNIWPGIGSDTFRVAASIVAVLIMVGLMINQSVFQRCPRCTGWVVPFVKSCPSCGLKMRLDNSPLSGTSEKKSA